MGIDGAILDSRTANAHLYNQFLLHFNKGSLTEEQIDLSLRRLFRARFRLGMFDPPNRVPWANTPFSVNEAPSHGELAVETARKSIVLLKNDDLLPLSKDLGTIAVIGPNANEVDVLLGNYNGIPSNPITPLEGIRRKVAPSTTVLYARGTDIAPNTPSMEIIPPTALTSTQDGDTVPGLNAEYFTNREFEGEPALTRFDSNVDFGGQFFRTLDRYAHAAGDGALFTRHSGVWRCAASRERFVAGPGSRPTCRIAAVGGVGSRGGAVVRHSR